MSALFLVHMSPAEILIKNYFRGGFGQKYFFDWDFLIQFEKKQVGTKIRPENDLVTIFLKFPLELSLKVDKNPSGYLSVEMCGSGLNTDVGTDSTKTRTTRRMLLLRQDQVLG